MREQLLPKDWDIFSGTYPSFNSDEYYQLMQKEMEKLGVIDADYDACPVDADKAYLENIRAGKEIKNVPLPGLIK